MSFPTGEFVQLDSYLEFSFDEDGTFRTPYGGTGTYTVAGDIYAEATRANVQAPSPALSPAIYHWEWDGWQLTFEVVEDGYDARVRVYTEQPWVRTQDSREVLLAARDLVPGEPVLTTLSHVPAAEADPTAFSSDDQLAVVMSAAAVPIEQGQIVTPDLLEPPAD